MRTTTERVTQLFRAMVIYFDHVHGVSDAELAILLNVKRATACRYRHQLIPYGVYKVKSTRYSMRPLPGMISAAHSVLIRARLEQSKLKKAKQATH